MNLIKKKYDHYACIPISAELNNNENFNLHIVYFINCCIQDNYMDWLTNQLNIVKNYTKNIHIVAVIEEKKKKDFTQYVNNFFPNNNLIYDFYTENEFEYRGILKVWEIGQIYNKYNDIILYFHSKGITRNNKYISNQNDDYNIILKDINKIKEIFSIFPSIDKVGYSAGGIGWIWYNFWYARGSYINQVEKPIKTKRRHYYEDWVARKVENKEDQNPLRERPQSYFKNTLESCYGFYNNLEKNVANIGTVWHPTKGPNGYFSIEPILKKKIMDQNKENISIKNEINKIETKKIDENKWYLYKKHFTLFDKYLLCINDSFLKKTKLHSSENKVKKATKKGDKIYFQEIINIDNLYYQIIVNS